MKTSQAQLDRWVRQWQQVLRLQDWQVKVELCRERDMKQAGCEGLNDHNVHLKRSAIQIRDPADHLNADFPADIEATIVHELLHLHFAGLYSSKGLQMQLWEQAIESIAMAFVGMKRERT
jgi:hypothetical protein